MMMELQTVQMNYMTMKNNDFDIKKEFERLQYHSAGEDTYKVLSIPGLQHKLGKSVEGYPMFFVCANESTYQSPDIIREMLSVEFNRLCQLSTYDGITERAYAIITLHSLEWMLQSTFIDVFMLMLQQMQSLPSRKELAVEVENLITIFSALQNPPMKKMQGLWGELLVIDKSKYPEVLINAWNSYPNAKFDFTMGRDKIEVKTTSTENRAHHFSLDQLNPSPNSRLLIASIIVRESGKGNGGMSVRNLYDQIVGKVTGAKERLDLYRIMAETVGKDITKLDSVYFDYTAASDSLLYYRAQDIPRIKKNDVPAGVTDVKFTSSLTDVIDVFSLDCASDYRVSPLFKSIC